MRRYVKTYEDFNAGPIKLYILFEPAYLEKYYNDEPLSFEEIIDGFVLYNFYSDKQVDQFKKGMDYAKEESFVSFKVIPDERLNFYRVQLKTGEGEYPAFEVDNDDVEDSDDTLNRLMSKSDNSYPKDTEEVLFYSKEEMKAFTYGIEQAEGWTGFEPFTEQQFNLYIEEYTPEQQAQIKRSVQKHHIR